MTDTQKRRKRLKKLLAERPTLWRYNDDVYLVENYVDGKYCPSIIRKSDGQVMARDVMRFGWNMSKGFHFGNGYRYYTNREGGRFKLIGNK